MRMNLGCGPQPVEGWVNIDRDSYGDNPLITVFDFAANDPLPYADETFDFVAAHHSLQMVDYLHIRTVLRDVHRILDYGGWFRISLPSIEKAWDAWKRGDKDWFPIVDQAETSIDGKFCAYLTWYSEARTLFTRDWLSELLYEVGFEHQHYPYESDVFGKDIGAEWEADLDSRVDESLWIVVQKHGD